MMNKLKKLSTVSTVICLLCGLFIVPVSAAADYMLDINDTDLNEDLTAVLFPPESMLLYPGETVESSIRIVNDTENHQIVNMTVRKFGTGEKNLADVIDLIITRDGESEEIYNGRLADVDLEVEEIQFPVDETGVYRFHAAFNPAGNEYMGGTADFQVIFSVDEIIVNPTTTPEPDPETTTPDETPATTTGGDDIPDVSDPPRDEENLPPAGPGPAEYNPPAAIIEAEEPPQETGAAPEDYEDIPDDEVPEGGATPGEESSAEPLTESPLESAPEEYEDIEDETVPLGVPEFIDKMPQTGENMNPLAYQLAGFGLICAGSIGIIGAKKKTKENEKK